MMSTFKYTDHLGKVSNIGQNSIKIPTYESYFKNDTTGKIFKFTNVEMLKYKRNKKINEFFEVYSSLKQFDLIEFGLPYVVTEKIERITQKLKRRCNQNNYPIMGFLWIFDVGEENFGAHYHLVIAIRKYSIKKYPDFLKINFKKKKLHGSFVKNRNAFRRYLLEKDIYERGKRKRVYGNSRRFNLSKSLLKKMKTT